MALTASLAAAMLLGSPYAVAQVDRYGLDPVFRPPPRVEPQALERLREPFEQLLTPEMHDRRVGSPGLDAAATLIVDRLRGLNLGPAFDRTEYRQVVQSRSVIGAVSGGITLHLPNRDVELPADQVEALPFGASGSLERRPVTFVGYSIAAGDNGYLGYPPALNMTGRVALALRFEPTDRAGRSIWAGQGWTNAANVIAKAAAADRRGADAVILLRPPSVPYDETDIPMQMRRLLGDEPLTRGPVLAAPASPFAQLVAAGDPEGRPLRRLIDAANVGPIIAELDGVSVSLHAQVSRETVVSRNLAAILPGRGPLAREFILVSTPYDLPGTPDGPGSAQPGPIAAPAPAAPAAHPDPADTNDARAIGASALLFIAETLATRYDSLGPADSSRSIVLLFTANSDESPSGFEAFLKAPPVPRRALAAGVTLDILGTLNASQNTLSLYGLASATTLADATAPVIAAAPFIVDRIDGLGSPQDLHLDRAGVPHLTLTTLPINTDPARRQECLALPPDLTGAAAAAIFAADLVHALATQPTSPAFTSPTNPDPASQTAAGTRGITVRTGFTPAADNGAANGVRVARVQSDSPAARAGLLPGDRITHWNGRAVSDVAEWTGLLPDHGAGDRVEVTLVRAGQSVTISITLEGRDPAPAQRP